MSRAADSGPVIFIGGGYVHVYVYVLAHTQLKIYNVDTGGGIHDD